MRCTKNSSLVGAWEVNRVHCNDALEGMRMIPTGGVDAVISDPPYGVTDFDWDRYPTQEELTEMLRISAGPVLLFGAAVPRAMYELLSLRPQAERIFIWHIWGTGTVSEAAAWNFQPVYVWNKKFFRGMKSDVMEEQLQPLTDRGFHKTPKPIELMKRMVIAGCPKGGTVLDPFTGGGTTLVAARECGRNYLGFEIDEGRASVARKRLAEVAFASYDDRMEAGLPDNFLDIKIKKSI